ncbi:RHS repeat-associated core domain-containing protein [Clostridium botulinum]|uniref:Wall-associated protein n=4 Tax=Clostridium botulinum TaxID=1491 RepID=A0A9Q1UZ94_CLOBO|nr:RHS repeat-associated core domain-containing protein [Clostridium botulinum]AEB75046.1 putative wall-associated protein [Clostridium botulinum BKT015925]KEI04208.1 wall-associated protein [Clostridium botulinum C/D str. Sp77]KLU74974.1 wall-associated protein [Clostridium botulinum V891]KOA77973.1 wall-associated protein [Clostridium botulinum]KOA79896.1 wall-associated protein [Clostridium botulinum]
MNLNGQEYYYIRNAQNDIIALNNSRGTTVATYTYDSWGKLLSIKDQNGTDITNNKDHVGYKNPYRYRGYRYDTETGLYYLNSRYYNSEWGRFVNADGIIGEAEDLLSYNMFAYCNNNCINSLDLNGEYAVSIFMTSAIKYGIRIIGAIASSEIIMGVAIVAAFIGTGALIYKGIQIYKASSSHAAKTIQNKNQDISNNEKNTPYSHLKDSSRVGKGKKFTATQKKKIIKENRKRNKGKVISDDQLDPYQELVQPRKSQKGVTPLQNEWQIDHIIPKSKGGTNSFGNARIISLKWNRIKWDK